MDWTKLILPGLIAGGSYLDYKDKKKRQKELDKSYSAYRAAQLANAAGEGGGGSSGGGGGGGGGGTGKAQAILEDYNERANAMLEPYVKVGREVLPVTSDAYKQGVGGFNSFAGQVFDPEFLKRVLTYNPPKEKELPAYLAGATK